MEKFVEIGKIGAVETLRATSLPEQRLQTDAGKMAKHEYIHELYASGRQRTERAVEM